MTATTSLFLAIALMQTPAQQPAEIALAVACGQSPDEITLTLRNAGETDTAVLLGRMLAGGQRYLPQELVVEVSAAGSSTVEQLVYRSADLPRGFASRMDHWVVSLPVMASFTLSLRASDFISSSGRPITQTPAELAVRLTGRPITFDFNADTGGMQDWRLWTGTAMSGRLRLAECAGSRQ